MFTYLRRTNETQSSTLLLRRLKFVTVLLGERQRSHLAYTAIPDWFVGNSGYGCGEAPAGREVHGRLVE